MVNKIYVLICLFLSGDHITNLKGLILGTGYMGIIFGLTWMITKKQTLGFGDIQLMLVLGYWLGDLRIFIVNFC